MENNSTNPKLLIKSTTAAPEVNSQTQEAKTFCIRDAISSIKKNA